MDFRTLKKDLTKVLILTGFFVLLMFVLFVLDNEYGVFDFFIKN